MRKLLALPVALFLTVGPALPQTQTDNTGDGDARSTHHLNLSWIGLLGLLGLVGMRRQKSATHQRLEASGVNVRSV
jgi:MYXO-CTERM domain-containing protein